MDPTLNSNARKILQLMAEGLSDRLIAERMALSIHTVKWYNRGIFAELGASSRSHAIRLAREARLLGLTPGEPARPGPRRNLPAAANSFVGREQELLVGHRLLKECRLLTLAGAPGSGKTRLGLEVARIEAESFEDGVWFVPLAPITEPARVMTAIADTLGISEVRGRTMTETLQSALHDRHLLLVLDNCEHVLGVGPQLARLLAAVPTLKILATSREVLGLYGEQVHVVSPLTLQESVELFIGRARAVRPAFELGENTRTIEEICRRLEGLPLSIELAAARTKLWPPEVLLARLDRRLSVLTASLRDRPARQQTLRATLDWSFRLLDDADRRMLGWLTVFRGPTDLEAVEHVLGPLQDASVSASLESLVDKSLIQGTEGKDGRVQILMLETIREYMLGEADGQELERAGDNHARYFAALAKGVAHEFRRSEYGHGMGVLVSAGHNLEASLEWLLSRPDPAAGVRMVHLLRDYWIASGHAVEGAEWAQKAAGHRTRLPPVLQAEVLTDAVLLAYHAVGVGPTGQEDRLLEEAFGLATRAGNQTAAAWALAIRGALGIGRPDKAELSSVSACEAFLRFRILRDEAGAAQAICILGELARTLDDDQMAEMAYRECLAIVRSTGEIRRESMALTNLGFLKRRRGELSSAKDLFLEGLGKASEYGFDTQLFASPVFSMAGILAQEGQAEIAAKLLGATQRILKTSGMGIQPGDLGEYERERSAVQDRLDSAAFQAAWDEGFGLSLPETLVLIENAVIGTS